MAKLLQRSPAVRPDSLRPWTINDSLDLYNVPGWSQGFFGINEQGHVMVTPLGPSNPAIDLTELVDELGRRDIDLPLLIRFSDILRIRIEQINNAFKEAIREHEYRGLYRGVYPIKVNQQRHVVEEIVHYGKPFNYGLEAGSKPELLAVLALLDSNESLIICNGYKDTEYLDMVLLATKLGRTIIPVIEKFSELEALIERSRATGIRPRIGIRIKLSTRGSGRWQESGGDRSKFGLSVNELVRAVELLRQAEMLDCFQLLHFHLGSQITNIRTIKAALAEGCRIFVELAQDGANLRYLDVGGGMAVDYDGSSSNFPSSANYTMQEYAADVISAVMESCNAAGVEHPHIVTEAGRAITAHHSVLIFDVLGKTEMPAGAVPTKVPKDAPQVLKNLVETHNSISRKNFQEAYHDAVHLRDEMLSLFNHGVLSLEQRSTCESVFWACAWKIYRTMRDRDYVPDELEGLESLLADTYFCNFSAFQSIPDCWAVQQLFPVMPLQRLNEQPLRRAVLADITCDSDGKVDKFIDLRDVKETLELHDLNGHPYHICIFMVGAYQEILGDMHNLFGDINAVHVRLDESGMHHIEHVVRGDSVREVLSYVQYSEEDMADRMRRGIESSVRAKTISVEDAAYFLRRYEQGLRGYTYLDKPPTSPSLTVISSTEATATTPARLVEAGGT